MRFGVRDLFLGGDLGRLGEGDLFLILSALILAVLGESGALILGAESASFLVCAGDSAFLLGGVGDLLRFGDSALFFGGVADLLRLGESIFFGALESVLLMESVALFLAVAGDSSLDRFGETSLFIGVRDLFLGGERTLLRGDEDLPLLGVYDRLRLGDGERLLLRGDGERFLRGGVLDRFLFGVGDLLLPRAASRSFFSELNFLREYGESDLAGDLDLERDE